MWWRIYICNRASHMHRLLGNVAEAARQIKEALQLAQAEGMQREMVGSGLACGVLCCGVLCCLDM